MARAIAEHYLPIQAGGELPASDIGAFVSMADKMDTICGCFGVGLIPSGSADPYALRRASLGIINIILDKEYRESLNGFIKTSLDLLEPKLTRNREEVHKDVLEFFRGRFVNLLADRYPTDAVDAAVAAGFDDLVDARARIAALDAFKGRDDFEPLAVAFKRVCNIVKEGVDATVDTSLFQDTVEGELFASFATVRDKVAAAVAGRKYMEALAEIATLRAPVDNFFDKVMIMADDPAVRTNRLALLTGIARLFAAIADFARIG